MESHEITRRRGILLTESGFYLEGESVGIRGTVCGELCFNTGMTGYQEIFTDPSYCGQITVMTFPHIGNYGVKEGEWESEHVYQRGLIFKDLSELTFRVGSKRLLDWLREKKVFVLVGVDTRSLVRHIRESGEMNAILSDEEFRLPELRKVLEQHPKMKGLELASEVTTKQFYSLGNPESQYRIAVYDYGIKKSILDGLVREGFFVGVFPARTPVSKVLAFEPDAFLLSNGPGDPAAMGYAVEIVKGLLQTGKPLFGICLGHQLLSLALGLETYKMPFGHHGVNHPVLNLITGKGEMTSQNHGFAVTRESAEAHPEVVITHKNLNDGTVEGIALREKPVSSVQYHPEASPGPHDSRYLFHLFRKVVEQNVSPLKVNL
jgi:carbamoyl-phosphate synthase small subunit